MAVRFDKNQEQIDGLCTSKYGISESCSSINSNHSVISDGTISGQTSCSTPSSEHENNETTNFFSFEQVVLDQLVKGFAVFILAFGIVAAIVYFLRQVLVEDLISNNTWKWVGSINSIFILLVTILIIVCKVWINNHKDTIGEIKRRNYHIFYILIFIPAFVLWISLVFVLVRNIEHFKNCYVISDIIMPVSRLLFIMVSILITHDLISYEIKPEAPTLFYLIYKSTAILTFATCISNLIFDFIDSESQFLQRFVSKFTKNPYIIYCSNETWSKEEVDIYNKMQSLTQGFSSIFHMLSIIVLLKSLNMLFHWKKTIHNNNETRQPTDLPDYQGSPNDKKFVQKHLSIILLLSIILFLLTFAPAILEFMTISEKKNLYTLNIISSSLPLLVYPFCGVLNIYLLKLFYYNYRLLSKNQIPIVQISVIWISLIGIIISLLKTLLVNFYELGVDQNRSLNIIQIVLRMGNIVESVLQAMMLDYLCRLKWDFPINVFTLTRIYYCCLALITANIGNLITNFVNQLPNDFNSCPNDSFHELLYGTLSSLCSPLMLIFRTISPIILLLFITHNNRGNINRNIH